MTKLKSFQCLISAISLVLALLFVQVHSQSSTICSAAMTRSFSPCINYLTTGSNASSPTEACCNSLKNLMANGQDCVCLIVTGGVPFKVPINRPLAMSLPRACKMSGVAIECRATASPVSAPNADEGAPATSPLPSPPTPRGPSISEFPPTSTAPESDIVPELTPPGMRPTLFPSAAHLSRSFLPSLFIMLTISFYLLRI